jgi:hypothetical protein
MTVFRILKNIKKANNSIWTEWIFRVIYSIEFVQTALVLHTDHPSYPDACWALLFIALWLYFFKFRILAFIPIFMCGFIHYSHFNI